MEGGVMTDREMANALLQSGAIADPRFVRCPCGVMQSAAPAFHRRQQDHDCVHHPRRSCGTCRAVDRMLAGIEARLYVEATSGPFIVTRWDR